jgi:fructose-1,6-bisphosphatase/inositol monophosphatase family enzyme
VPLCYVASGNFDFSLCYAGMGSWDIIAPQLIIEEAGGICEITKYSENKYSIIAGSKETVTIIKEIIKKHIE